MIRLVMPMVVAILLSVTGNAQTNANITKQKRLLVNTEEEFAKMAVEQGIAAAFYFYADSNVVIKRGDDSLIYGKNGVLNYYSKPVFKTAIISWHPDFVDVSASGDLAYTYGKYQYLNIDSNGKKVSASGIFHTVWKKQRDGTWRFVWD